MSALDNIILEEIKKLATDPTYIHEIKEERSILTDEEGAAKLIREEVKKLDAQRSRFMDLYGLGEFPAEELQEKIRPLKEQKERLLAELDALTGGEPDLSVEEAAELVEDFADILNRGVFSEIRLVIESLIKHIEICNEDIMIFWKFA